MPNPNKALIVGAIILGGVTACSNTVSGTAVAGPGPASTGSSKTSTSSPKAATISCEYTRTTDKPAAKNVGLPDNPGQTPSTGTVQVTLKTEQGDIVMTLDRAKAPCTVRNFLSLAEKKFYDSTPCHRLTAAASLKVLQCGDPTGTGTGTPGYEFADELPKDLKPVTGEIVVYPTATVAMANAGPGTNGSQFFLVYAESQLPPNYSVFGTYSAASQTVLDKIVAGGITESPNLPGGEDGAPKTPVTIQQAVVGS